MQVFSPPLSSSPRGVFAKIAREFQILCFGLSYYICVMVAFYLLNAANVFSFSIGTVLQ